jgi:membrane-associated phospholipid phosphatase
MKELTETENNCQKKLTTILISPYFALVCFSLVILSYFFIDRPLATYLYPLSHNPEYATFIKAVAVVSFLGKGYFLVGLFGIIAVLNYVILENKALSRIVNFTLVALILSTLICEIIKIVLARSRPELFFQNQIYGLHFFAFKTVYHSFPSGHATAISAAMLSLSYFLRRFTPLFLLLILVVCITRLLLGDHYLSDVIGGFYLGTVTAAYLYSKGFPSPFGRRCPKGG